jgi:hypothetical protein
MVRFVKLSAGLLSFDPLFTKASTEPCLRQMNPYLFPLIKIHININYNFVYFCRRFHDSHNLILLEFTAPIARQQGVLVMNINVTALQHVFFSILLFFPIHIRLNSRKHYIKVAGTFNVPL